MIQILRESCEKRYTVTCLIVSCMLYVYYMNVYVTVLYYVTLLCPSFCILFSSAALREHTHGA